MSVIRLMLVDDHKIIREGLKSLLEDIKEIEIVAEAENGKSALELASGIRPHIIIMDINMPGMSGIEATKQIKSSFPDIQILALTMFKEDGHIRKMIEAGASGYVLKDSGKEDLLNAIRKIAGGKYYFSPEISDHLLLEMLKPEQKTKETSRETVHLTDREKEVLSLIVKEYTNAEIALKLNLSIRTVDAHRRNLLEKTGARNTAGLVKFALRKGIAL